MRPSLSEAGSTSTYLEAITMRTAVAGLKKRKGLHRLYPPTQTPPLNGKHSWREKHPWKAKEINQLMEQLTPIWHKDMPQKRSKK